MPIGGPQGGTPAAAAAAERSPLDSLAGALVEANDQLLALYELATITSQSLDENDAVGEILERATRLVGADRLVMQVGDTEFIAEQTDRVNRGRRATDAPSAGSAPVSAVAEVATTGYAATLTATRVGHTFGTADHKLLTAVATMALGAVQTSRHHHDALTRAVMSRDHDTASELAQQSLPSWRPSLPGVELFARSDPARSAGGDLFTFAVQDGSLHFVIGDVSGKGLPAAMMMTTVISAATAAFQTTGGEGPAAVLASIDAWVHDYLSDAGLFVTLMAGAYHPSEHRLVVASAGHGPIVFRGPDGVRSIDASVPPIGVLSLATFGAPDDIELDAPVGSRLVVSSDGFTEQEDPTGSMWGDDALIEEVRTSTLGADDFGAELFVTLDAHADGSEQADDRTLLILDVIDV